LQSNFFRKNVSYGEILLVDVRIGEGDRRKRRERMGERVVKREREVEEERCKRKGNGDE
jgi:hypothetical protein